MDNEYKQHPSPTGHFVDGHLVPVPESVEADLTVWLGLERASDDKRQWEGLAAHPCAGDDRVEVRAVPLFAYDVNYGDEVSVVQSAEGLLVATGVTRDGGNFTFRVWLPAAAEVDEYRRIVTEFGELGCLIEGYSDQLLGLSCGRAESQVVADALHTGERRGRFQYETGRQQTS